MTCHCGKGCKIIRVGGRPPTTKCYLLYLHKLWKSKGR